MLLSELISNIGTYQQLGEGNPEITAVVNDTRQVSAGCLFICIKGYTVDSHDLAAEAVQQGAVAVLAERTLDLPVPVIVVKDTFRLLARVANEFYQHPSKAFQLVGVTGTNGKTTTTTLIEQTLQALGQKTGLIGTMHNKVLNEEKPTANTTPDGVRLQSLFAEMREAGVETAVMEVSSQALQLGRVHGTVFDVCVFTNLSQDHLDYHRTMEAYCAAKSLLFAQMGNDFSALAGKYAVLNADDPASAVMRAATPALISTYGIEKEADIRARDIVLSLDGTSFVVETAEGSWSVQARLIGLFNVYNILAAISVCRVLGWSMEEVIAVVEKIPGVRGRFEPINLGQDFSVLVDYACTPDSLENVLKTVQEFAEGNIYCIIGCGGDRDKTKRPLMAQVVCELSTKAIFTMDNPRTENPKQILMDMEAGVVGRNFITIQDRAEAIDYAVNIARPKDVILIAGKGHEDYQILGTTKIHFDDKEIAMTAIEKRLQ